MPSANSQEVETVRWLFQTFVNTTRSTRSLVVELNRRQVPSPSGKQWDFSHIKNMLKNPDATIVTKVTSEITFNFRKKKDSSNDLPNWVRFLRAAWKSGGLVHLMMLDAPIGPPTVTDGQNPVSFQYQVAHQAVLPTVVSHATRLAVVLEACPPGEWCAGLVAGVASVNIYVPSAHLADWQGLATVDGTVSQLVSDPAGPVVVLWCGSATAGQTNPETSGLQKARVLLPAMSAASTRLPRLGRLEADLAYNGTASVRLLTGAVGAESPSSPAEYVTAHNLLYRTLWSGASVSLLPHDVTGADPATYRITWSDAATRVRGVSDTAIASGASGSVSSLLPIDGRVGPSSSITARNVLANFGISGGVAVWCEWTEANSRWEIYSADCPPPSP